MHDGVHMHDIAYIVHIIHVDSVYMHKLGCEFCAR